MTLIRFPASVLASNQYYGIVLLLRLKVHLAEKLTRHCSQINVKPWNSSSPNEPHQDSSLHWQTSPHKLSRCFDNPKFTRKWNLVSSAFTSSMSKTHTNTLSLQPRLLIFADTPALNSPCVERTPPRTTCSELGTLCHVPMATVLGHSWDKSRKYICHSN